MLVKKSHLSRIIKDVVSKKMRQRHFSDLSSSLNSGSENVKKKYSPSGVREVKASIFDKTSWRYMAAIRRAGKKLNKDLGEMTTRMSYTDVVSLFMKINEQIHEIELNMARIRRMI